MTTHTELTIDQAKRGDLICGKSDRYNGGKQFTGEITRVRGDCVSFTCKNGRSRQIMEIREFTEYKITGYR